MGAIGRVIGALCLVAMASAPPAGAQDGAEQGYSVIESVDVGASSVMLGGVRYEVTDRTEIEGADGYDLDLAELPSVAGGASSEEAAAWYEVAEGGGAGVRSLVRLRLTGGMPR